MQKVIIIKNCKYQEGETVIVNANEAHSLIDGGYAILYKEDYEDKMMRSKRSKKWAK